MQTQLVAMEAMRHQARWTPDAFLAPLVDRAAMAYPSAPLGSLVAERKENIDPQAYPTHRFNYLGLEHVQSTTGDLVDFAPRQGKEIRSRSKIFRHGDILYGRLRPYLNKVYLAQGPVSSGICSGEFYVLIPEKTRILPEFLRAVLSSEYVQPYVASRQTGTALFRIHLDDLLSIYVPVPPMEMQQAFEDFLGHERMRRRRLAAEVAALPQAMLEAVVQALASGDQPYMPTCFADHGEDEVNANSLPRSGLLVQHSFGLQNSDS